MKPEPMGWLERWILFCAVIGLAGTIFVAGRMMCDEFCGIWFK